MKSAIGAILLLVVSACSRPENAADAAVRACFQQGGNWQRVCVAQEYTCVKPFPDAGKACKDSSECKGECLVELVTRCEGVGNCTDPVVPEPGAEVTGICQRDDDPCGSFIFVRKGRALPIEHRD